MFHVAALPRRAGAGRRRPCGAGHPLRSLLRHVRAKYRSRKIGAAIPRGEFGLCDPRKSDNHRRISAPGICRPHASLLAATPSLARVRAATIFRTAEPAAAGQCRCGAFAAASRFQRSGHSSPMAYHPRVPERMSTKSCPYCVAEMALSAIVCGRCGRDWRTGVQAIEVDRPASGLPEPRPEAGANAASLFWVCVGGVLVLLYVWYISMLQSVMH